MVSKTKKSICLTLVLLLFGMLLVVMPAPAFAASSSFTLTGETYPTSLTKGQSFGLTGTIKSTVTIDRVTVGVYNEDKGAWADGATYREYGLGSKSYNIKTADPYVKFGTLSAGNYTYRVWVKDVNGTSKYLLKKPFTVKSSSSSSSGSSSFSISGANYPTTLTKGKSFSIYGTIKSTYTISRVTVGVYNETKGQWVDTAVYRKYSVGAKSYSISNADPYVKFGTLPAGSYTYRVWVKDVKGASKYLLKKSFTVKSSSSSSTSTAASSFSISGANYPTTLTKGKSFSIYGTVKSTYNISRVTVGVYNETKGQWVDTAVYRKYSVGAKSYSISNADPYVKFGTLPAGSYTYRVWVKDVKGASKYVLKKAFTVKSSSSSSAGSSGSSTTAASSFSISGANYPTALTKGSSYSISGTIKSTYKIKTVTVGVYNEDKDAWADSAVYRKYNVGTKTFDISKADETVKFSALGAGNYTYRVWVKDEKGASKYLLKKPFTVKNAPKASAPAAVLLSYNTSLIKSIGKQPYTGPCGVYSMAYARAVIDGKFPLGGYSSYEDKIISEYGHGSSYAYWSEGGGTLIMYSTVSSLYRSAFDQLAKGVPCIINCYNPNTGNNHFVLVIGYVKGTTRTNVTLDSFIVLDPATGTKRNMADTGYETPANSPYGPELIKF